MRPYQELRKELYGLELGQREVGRLIGRSAHYVCERINGKGAWTIAEAYILLRAIGAEPEDIIRFFPPEGRAKKK